MTDTTTQAVTALLENVTPGPWRASETWRPPIGNFPHGTNANGNVFWGYSISGSNENGGRILPTLAAVHNFPDKIHGNARFIAAARDLVPALLAERDAAQTRARESALEALAAYGQAAEAHEAQMKAEGERERLALAICGGEDLPGYANAASVEALEKIADQNRKWSMEMIDRVLAAEAALATARGDALEEAAAFVAANSAGVSPREGWALSPWFESMGGKHAGHCYAAAIRALAKGGE